MNSKRRKTPAAIFDPPTSGTIAWADIESLLIAVGCRVVEGSGSRVRFVKGEEAVDDYIDTCAKIGKAPQKPYSGRIMVRVDP